MNVSIDNLSLNLALRNWRLPRAFKKKRVEKELLNRYSSLIKGYIVFTNLFWSNSLIVQSSKEIKDFVVIM